MRHYFPLGTMLWLLCILQLMFYMACSCIVEERIALMRVRSSFVEANSEFPESWGQSDDCCSWEGVGCNSDSRVSDLNLECKYIPLSDSDDEGGCIWNMNLTMFSPFHELQLLELSQNSAYLKSFEGTRFPSQVPMHMHSATSLTVLCIKAPYSQLKGIFLRSSRID
jgi:hypothetical protein